MSTSGSSRGAFSPSALAAAVVLSAAFLAACSSGTGNGSTAAASAPSITIPLATSLQNPDGTWATVAMGHLGDPLNTFWQLFFRPAHSSTWTDQVQATAVATNGGLVLAAPPGMRALSVGVLPSNQLTLSPLVSTRDAGRSWSNGLVSQGLAATPGSLATTSTGRAFALTDARAGSEVLASETGLSSWSVLTSKASLAATPAGKSCGVQSLTAVSYAGDAAVVGGSCTHPGVAGIFVDQSGGWTLAGPSLPVSISGDRVEVLAMEAVKNGLSALLAVSGDSGTALVAAWGSGSHWSTSTPLTVPSGDTVASVGPDGSLGMFALIDTASGAATLDTVAGPSGDWVALPHPPSGTATVAFGPGGAASALAVNVNVLTVWNLSAPTAAWVKGQVVKVAIPYGSSS